MQKIQVQDMGVDEESSKTSLTSIVVGLQVNGEEQWLVDAASRIAVALKAQLILVHVIESPDGRMVRTDMEYLDRDLARARQMLRDYARQLPDSVSVTTTVLRGDNPSGYLAAPELFGSSLMLIVGSSSPLHEWLPKGASVIQDLLSHLTLPLLVIRQAKERQFAKKPLRLLIADDLTDSFEIVLKSLVRIFGNVPNLEVYHIHISEPSLGGADRSLSQVNLRQRWHKASNGSPLETCPYKAEVYSSEPIQGLLQVEALYDVDVFIMSKKSQVSDQNLREPIPLGRILSKAKSLLVIGE